MGGNFVGSGDFAESLGKFGPARSHILEVGDEQFLRNKRYVNFNGSK